MGGEADVFAAPGEGADYMAVSKAQQRAVHKYVKDNYDRMELTVPKGRKAEIKALAESRGQSVNAFVNEAIDAAMSSEAVPAFLERAVTTQEKSDEMTRGPQS